MLWEHRNQPFTFNHNLTEPDYPRIKQNVETVSKNE